MSRDDRDQRGGHPQHPKRWGTRACACCDGIPPAIKDPDNRTRREREARKQEDSS